MLPSKGGKHFIRKNLKMNFLLLLQLSVIFFIINLPLNVETTNDIKLLTQNNNNFDYDKYKIDLIELSEINYMIGISRIAVQYKENSSVSSSSTASQSTQCQNEFLLFLNAIENRKVWALKLIDSYGNIPKGINWGNYFWFTSKELCDDLNEPYNISLSTRYPRYRYPDVMNSTSPFPVKYQMMYFNFTTPFFVDIKLQLLYYIHIGLCIPKSCSSYEIIKYGREYFENKSFEPQQLYDIEMRYLGTKEPGFYWSFLLNPGLVLFGMALTTVLTFVCLAEIITRIRNRHPDFKKVGGNNEESYSTIEKFLLCWSIRDNLTRTLSAENSKNFFPVIAGLRTIVCLWVTLFHVYYYSLYTINNIPLLFAKLENYILQPVLQSCFYVDVFFVISAFLHVYHFLMNTNRMESIRKNSFLANVKLFLRLVLNRYIRLMPVFFVVMVLSEAMFEFLNMYSPFVMDKYNGIYCRETWWYNILFINNFLDLKHICASWTWYLGCEMQFFIVFLVLLFIYAKNESHARFLFVVGTMFFTLISFYTNYHHGITFELDVVYSTIEQLYVKPWTRIVPYFGGALMGWIYYKSKLSQKTIELNKCFLTFYWIFVGVIYLLTCEMSYWRKAPVWIVSFIMSFGKLFFGILWGSVIFVCQHGYGGILTTIMGSKIFLYLNKLCFSVYMVAPILITALYGLRTESTQFSEVGSASDLIAVLSLCFTATILLVVLLELPCTRISNRFILKNH